MTSRFTLLASVAGLALAGCSAPAEEGRPGPAPLLPPPGFQTGAGGTTGQVGAPGTGGSTATAGTGGAAPAANAGAGGSAVATAGTGGAPANAGAGGMASTIPSGTGNLITHDAMGWVVGSSNGVGIQGSFYPFSDADEAPPGTTTITMDDFAASPTTVCTSGVASAVPDATGYAQYWGGGVGLNLADAGGTTGAGPWTRGTVTGFSFTVTGPTVPPGFRFNATTPTGTTYCFDGLSAGANTVTLASLTEACYATPPGAALAPATTLEAIQWQVVTVLTTTTPFDFCIENLTAITAP